MKITIQIYQSIKEVREAYAQHYGKQRKKPTVKELKDFIAALVEGDLEAVMTP